MTCKKIAVNANPQKRILEIWMMSLKPILKKTGQKKKRIYVLMSHSRLKKALEWLLKGMDHDGLEYIVIKNEWGRLNY